MHEMWGAVEDSIPVGRWVDPVHPVPPENRQHSIRSHHTIEKREHDKEKRQHVRDDREARRKGADPLSPTGLEEEE